MIAHFICMDAFHEGMFIIQLIFIVIIIVIYRKLTSLYDGLYETFFTVGNDIT